MRENGSIDRGRSQINSYRICPKISPKVSRIRIKRKKIIIITCKTFMVIQLFICKYITRYTSPHNHQVYLNIYCYVARIFPCPLSKYSRSTCDNHSRLQSSLNRYRRLARPLFALVGLNTWKSHGARSEL